MQIQMSGWKKLYLFYGIVFFGLGLLGFLLTNRIKLREIGGGAFADFFQELAEVGLAPRRASREVTVSNLGTMPIYVVCQDSNEARIFEGIAEQIQRRPEERVQVHRVQAAGKEWFKTKQINRLLSEYRFIIGLDEGEKEGDLKKSGIVFSIPETMTAEFLDRLLNRRPEIASFKLDLISREPTPLYRLDLGKSMISSGLLMEVIDMLLDLWVSSASGLKSAPLRL